MKLRNQRMKKASSLSRLDHFLDKDGILRVGGRIERANVPLQVKHPVIIPEKSLRRVTHSSSSCEGQSHG